MKKILKRYLLLFLFFLVGFQQYSICQNTGIGTTSPLEKLQVAGNIKADTLKPNVLKLPANAGAAKILISDAAGNGSWQINTLALAGSVGFGDWGDCAANANISEYNPVFGEEKAVSKFGESLSMSGNFAIIGNRFDSVGLNFHQGSASIYKFNGTNWVFMQKLIDATGASNDEFGSSVAISGNYAIAGAYLDDVGVNTDQGSCSIYQFNGTNWVLMNKITDPAGQAQSYFGSSVSISGNYVLIGALKLDLYTIGTASIFHLSGGNWAFMQKLADPAGTAPGDFSALSVSVSGTKAAVTVGRGKVGDNNLQGYVNVYELSGATWVYKQRLADLAGNAGDNFGNSVSISDNYLIVGDENVSVGTNFSQGNASIYYYNGTNWILMQKLIDMDGEANDGFGHTVSISGNYALISAVGNKFNNGAGSATIYQRVGLGWTKLQLVTQLWEGSTGFFGYSTAIEGASKRFVIGYFAGSGKAIFGKIN